MSLESRFFTLYRGLTRARGLCEPKPTVSEKGKRASKNQTLHAQYTEDNWRVHLHGTEGLGVIPITDEGTCSWGAIDVDIYPLDLVDLEKKVKEKELPLIVLRSKSGGAHLTVFFKHMEQCSVVRTRLAEISLLLGLGDREIYPKQVKLANKADVGNWLNMPYFEGAKTERYAVINGVAASVEEFLDYAEHMSLDGVDALEVTIPEGELSDGPPCLQKLTLFKAGQGERNSALFNFGVYCRLKWESDWETQLEEFNRLYMSTPLNHREVAAMVKSLEKKNYAYTCNNVPISNYCNREACKGREFGVTAFQHVDVGIILDSISKMKSEPPMWVLSLEGVRTEVETDDLLDQNRFRRVCVNTINKIPGRMKGEDWDKFIRNKLSNIEFIEMPIETRVSDLVLAMIPKFFESTPTATNHTEIGLGRWYTTEEAYLLRGTDYIDFLHRQSVEIDKRKLWSVLTTHGISAMTMKNMEIWKIPITLYTPDPNRRNKYTKPQVEQTEF